MCVGRSDQRLLEDHARLGDDRHDDVTALGDGRRLALPRQLGGALHEAGRHPDDAGQRPGGRDRGRGRGPGHRGGLRDPRGRLPGLHAGVAAGVARRVDHLPDDVLGVLADADVVLLHRRRLLPLGVVWGDEGGLAGGHQRVGTALGDGAADGHEHVGLRSDRDGGLHNARRGALARRRRERRRCRPRSQGN